MLFFLAYLIINESDFNNNNNNNELISQLQKEIIELKQKITELEAKNIDISGTKLYTKRKSDILYLIKLGKPVTQTIKNKLNYYNINFFRAKFILILLSLFVID